MKTLRARFEAKVSPEPTSGCWLWAGSPDSFGYGALMFQGRREKTHRIAWKLYRGAIPTGACVLHKCDNPPCVNPDHLFLGTKRDNLHDAMRKGRASLPPVPRGTCNSHAKLSDSAVREIRKRARSGERQSALAREYGVSPATLCEVIKRKVWAHVTDGEP